VSAVLPETVVFSYAPWPDEEGVEMQFRLTYQGHLPAAKYGKGGTRAQEKHAIRRVLHPQLRILWQTHPLLKKYVTPHNVYVVRPGALPVPGEPIESGHTVSSIMADNYARCGYRFLPLIGNAFGEGYETACALDILFLRRDQPGNLVEHGGDIDNRIKVLFDALKMPQQCEEVDKSLPGPDEDPFFVLLENDSLISEVKVTTDRLLTPIADGEHIHDVHLIIHVKTVVVGSTITVGSPHGFAAFMT
jgi:hypothetical protein